MLTRKTAKAHAILAILYAKAGPIEFATLTVRPYANGEEVGFHIKTELPRPLLAAVFSESKNSPDMVVVTGKCGDFLAQGNIPTSEIYKDRRYFPPDGYTQAAEYVLQFLIGEKFGL